MTLLELLLATTVLAVVTAMVSALWAQTRDWSRENARPEQALRLPRALRLLEDQWSRRRAVADEDDQRAPAADAKPEIFLVKDRLEFITAEPILFPDWPLVRVAYTAQREDRLTVGAESTASLVYEETRIVNPSMPEAEGAGPSEDNRRRIVLLEDCAELRFERDLATTPSQERTPDQPLPIDRLWSEAESDAPSAAPRADASASQTERTDQSGETDDDDPSLRAGRIVGEYRGESFSWVFLVEGSLSL